MHNLFIIIPLLILLTVFLIYSSKLKTYLNFRKASPTEGAVLKDLGLISYSEHKNVFEPQHWQTMESSLKNDEMWLKLIEISTAFVCENNNTIVGMAFLIPSGNSTDIYSSETSYIRLVGVHPDYKGRGIAKKLTQMCIDEAKQTGEKMISLHTSEYMPAAQHIYKSLGFKTEREIAPRFGKRYWLFQLDLSLKSQ